MYVIDMTCMKNVLNFQGKLPLSGMKVSLHESEDTDKHAFEVSGECFRILW